MSHMDIRCQMSARSGLFLCGDRNSSLIMSEIARCRKLSQRDTSDTLALIPEVLACSIIAGVDPKVGLYASVCIAKRSLARLK